MKMTTSKNLAFFLFAAATTVLPAVSQAQTTAPSPDMMMVPRAEHEQLMRDVAELKSQLAALKAAMPMAEDGSMMGSAAKPTDKGWYVGVGLGQQHRADAKDKIGAATVFENPGYLVNAALGRKLGKGFRIEGETGLFNNVNKREIVTGAFNEPANGNISLQTFMLNAYYDVSIKNSRIKPFIGVGVGVFQSQVNGLTSPTLSAGVPGTFGPTVVDTRSKYTAASQFKAGVGYELNRKTDLFFNYRLFRGNSFRLNSPTLGVLDVNRPRINGLELGVRAKF